MSTLYSPPRPPPSTNSDEDVKMAVEAEDGVTDSTVDRRRK